MDVNDLVRDVRTVRERGIGLKVEGVPALKEALMRRWPEDPTAEHRLEELIVQAAGVLDSHAAEGIRLALGIGRLGGSSADRREDFAAHYERTAETVRKARAGQPSLEEQAFTALARAILSLPGIAEVTANSQGLPANDDVFASAPASAERVALEPVDMMRSHGIDAERRGRWDEATEWWISALALVSRRATASPGDHEGPLADAYLRTGLSCLVAGQLDESLLYVDRAARISETMAELATRDPDDSEARLALALFMLGLVHGQTGQTQEGEVLAARATDLFQRIVDRNPGDADYSALLAFGLVNLGVFRDVNGNTEEAESTLLRAVGMLQKLLDLDLEESHIRLQLGLGLTVLGMLRVTADREPDAEEVLVRAISVLNPLVDDDQRVEAVPLLAASAPTTLAQAHFFLALVHADAERVSQAEEALVRFDELVAGQVQVSTVVPAPAMLLKSVTLLHPFALAMLGMIYRDSNRTHDAEVALSRAVDLFDQMENDAATQGLLSEVLEALSDIYDLTGRARAAREARARYQVIRLTLGDDDPSEG